VGGAAQAPAGGGHQPVAERLSDGQRFYISQTWGHDGHHSQAPLEHEYAVVDAVTSQTIALFIATRPRYMREEPWAEERRRTHLRARECCHALNLAEALAVPATNGVAGGGGELGEGLVLDDLAGVRRGDHLAVADVHHDVAGPA
jgi:hypothetical protein